MWANAIGKMMLTDLLDAGLPQTSICRNAVSLTTTIQHSFGSFSHSNQRRKINKRNPDLKRRTKTLTVCWWCDPLHRKP